MCLGLGAPCDCIASTFLMPISLGLVGLLARVSFMGNTCLDGLFAGLADQPGSRSYCSCLMWAFINVGLPLLFRFRLLFDSLILLA